MRGEIGREKSSHSTKAHFFVSSVFLHFLPKIPTQLFSTDNGGSYTSVLLAMFRINI